MRAPAILLLMAAGAMHAGEGAAYLKIPQGARSSALAGAMASSVGSAEAMWYTPAALPGIRGIEATLSRMAWIGETKNDFIALALPLGSTRSQGLGIYGNLIGTEDISRDSFGNDGAKFGNSAMTFGGAYGVAFGPLALGLGLKQYQEKFADQASSGLGFDFGTQLRFADGAFRMAAATQNMGSGPGYSAAPLSGLGSVKPPVTYRVGVAAEHKVLGLMGTLEYRLLPESAEATFCAGSEYVLRALGMSFALRAGYEGASARIGGLSGLTLGGGFEMAGLVADFAWLPQGVLGNPYRMSLGWRFATGR